MSNFSVKGKLKEVFDVVEGVGKESGKTWRKRSFLVDTGAEYDNLFCIEAFGSDKIELIDAYNIGDNVEVLFNIKTNEWKGKYFVSLGLWKFVTDKATPIMGDVNVSSPEANEDGEDELPF